MVMSSWLPSTPEKGKQSLALIFALAGKLPHLKILKIGSVWLLQWVTSSRGKHLIFSRGSAHSMEVLKLSLESLKWERTGLLQQAGDKPSKAMIASRPVLVSVSCLAT